MHRNAVKLILMSFTGGENCPSSRVALLSRLGPVHILRNTFRFGGFVDFAFAPCGTQAVWPTQRWPYRLLFHLHVKDACMYQWCNICSISLQLDILICQNNSSHLGSCCVLSYMYMYDMIILCEAPRWQFSLNLKVFEAQASNQACSMFILQVSSVWPHWHWLKILI